MSRWSSGRVIRLGDAAHAPSPLTGMGTSLAIIGAYCLAGEISNLEESDNPLAAFQLYEDSYRPFVQRIQLAPFGPTMPRVFHPDESWKRSVIHCVMWIIAKIVNMPLIKKATGSREDECNDNDFPLLSYPKLEAKCALEKRSSQAMAMHFLLEAFSVQRALSQFKSNDSNRNATIQSSVQYYSCSSLWRCSFVWL